MIKAFITAAFKSALSGGTVPLILGAVFLGSVTTAWVKGASYQKAKCETASLKDTIAEQAAAMARLKAQLAVAESARMAAAKRSIRDAEETAKSKELADDFKKQIRSRPDRLVLSPDDAERLRRIGR